MQTCIHKFCFNNVSKLKKAMECNAKSGWLSLVGQKVQGQRGPAPLAVGSIILFLWTSGGLVGITLKYFYGSSFTNIYIQYIVGL